MAWAGSQSARRGDQLSDIDLYVHTTAVIPLSVREAWVAEMRSSRADLNHRVAALLASYFDVIFALNRVLHPGEKRLMEWAQANCAQTPVGMAEQVAALLQATCSTDGRVVKQTNVLLDNLDDLLHQQGFDPATSLPQ